MSNARAVGVIDIGSNTIKSLLATRTAHGRVEGLRREVAEVRLGSGAFRATRELDGTTMERAATVVANFAEALRRHGAHRLRAVATSAVRDASNGHAFARLVRDRAGLELDILTGSEEAHLIGRGLLCDPDLPATPHVRLADLGGGSLEMLAFSAGALVFARSLQLGCVRLAARHHADLEAPLPSGAIAAIEDDVRARFAEAGIEPAHYAGPLVGTGGSVTAARGIVAARLGVEHERGPSRLSLGELETQLATLAPLPLAARRRAPGLPPGRADVYPVALAVLIATARLAGADAYHHSWYNLRFGLAAELLDRMA
jgi:exopolyphosphatase/guanosine-5'-triphosphate,3'-diphosphate pyrophosphatase